MSVSPVRRTKVRPIRSLPRVEHLENRQLLTATVDNTLLPFTNAKGSPASLPRLVTLTNTGSSSIQFNIAALSGDTTDFAISSKPAAGTVIPANGTIQVGVTFTAPSTTTTVTLHTASLLINTTDTTNPNLSVNLRALALTGYQGGPEPSLEQVINTLYQIPFSDGFPATTLTLPYTLNAANQTNAYANEVVTQTFVKAGTGPVTVEPLATFGPAASMPLGGADYTWGYYTPGSAASTTPVFTGSTPAGSPAGGDGQTVDPTITLPAMTTETITNGNVVNFDPGSSPFGIYDFFPVDNPVLTAYSQDLLNKATPDGAANQNRRIRFWPLQNSGGIVPNAYVAGIEEATNNDLQDVVFIVTNVKIVPAEVTSVSVNSSGGTAYAIPGGANQLNDLPFNNLNQVSITFSKDVDVVSTDLSLTGNGASDPIQSFSYDATTYTAKWTFTNTLTSGHYQLSLSGVTDTSSTPTALDGEWTDGVSSFPSGDGTVGGNFNFGLNVLPLAISSSQVGDGSVQRSSIHTFSVTFNQAVNFSSSSFTLYQATLNADGSVASYTNNVSSGVSFSSTDNITWTFTGISGGSLDRNGAGGIGFLADGVYLLQLHGAAVTDKATGLATLVTGDEVVPFPTNESGATGTTAQAFHVLYGDINGDAHVTNGDLNKFKQAFTPLGGTYNAAFDFDNNGAINNGDLNLFKKRFLTGFTY